MRLLLVNPRNAIVSYLNVKESRWHKYRIWRPLNLLVLAGLTPPEWQIRVIDENRGVPNYRALAPPHLVGITAATPQANRAYEIAEIFRERGVPVVIGGLHATMRQDEALRHADSVVAGEAESVWAQVLEDARRGALERVYTGEHLEMSASPMPRHDLLPTGYKTGSIQTTRGCPLNCTFCSVTAFNGGRFRHRPIGRVVEELELIRQRNINIVDDNFVGTKASHIARTKELMRAVVRADLGKRWIGQASINMADDDELLRLLARAGCVGALIGLESPSAEGVAEVNKRFNLHRGRDLRASVRRIQRHGILAAGSFVIGLDVDGKGVGRRIVAAAREYGLDALFVSFLTPFPGTQLWERMAREGRIVADDFPADWRYYTMNFPVARFRQLSWRDALAEFEHFIEDYYRFSQIARRVFGNVWSVPRSITTNFLMNLSFRSTGKFSCRKIAGLDLSRGAPVASAQAPEGGQRGQTPG